MAQSNHTTIATNLNDQIYAIPPHAHEASLIQFGTLYPMVIWLVQEFSKNAYKSKPDPIENKDEGWTLVRCQKKRKTRFVQRESYMFWNYKRKHMLQKNKKKISRIQEAIS